MAPSMRSGSLISLLLLLLLVPFAVFFSPSDATRPQALVAPVSKDPATLQYTTLLYQRTPSVPVKLVVDLSGRYLRVLCSDNYTSSTFRPVSCKSLICDLISANYCIETCNPGPPQPGCTNNTCSLPGNEGALSLDVLSLPTTDGYVQSSAASVASVLSSCLADNYLRVAGASGIAGLSRARTAVPYQVFYEFYVLPSFALCLPSTPRAPGVLFFGSSPYGFFPALDASRFLLYTPLLADRSSEGSTADTSLDGQHSDDYLIGVTAIKVGEAAVPINNTLLTFSEDTGYGGTKISTAVPYTALETTIYEAVTAAFAAALANMTKAAAVAPFTLCYDEEGFARTRLGAGVPAIDLVLHNETVYWRIYGANSMVEAKDGVLCFAFVDGGRAARSPIVIGGFQLEDNLVEFNLVNSMVGFSSTLLSHQITCSDFNFTSSAR